MRHVGLCVVITSACGAAATAPTPAHDQAVVLDEGTPVALDADTTLTATNIRYERGPDGSRDLSTCTLVVRHLSDRAQLDMAREHGGSDPESSSDALGWRLTLKVADPFHRPPRATVAVRKL